MPARCWQNWTSSWPSAYPAQLPAPTTCWWPSKPPGAPLDLPPPQLINWEEGIIFQRWIKLFRIPVQAPGYHAAAILLDGTPLGEASFLVRLKEDTGPADS